jgi:putative lumazine-binding protein
MMNSAVKDLYEAVQRYFDLMYDCDVSNFEKVFHPTSQLHGFREGKMTMWSASEYKGVLAKRESPKSLSAPRDEAILLLDVASETQALVKAKVRINAAIFIDYLTFHKIEGSWKITSKGYHLQG